MTFELCEMICMMLFLLRFLFNVILNSLLEFKKTFWSQVIPTDNIRQIMSTANSTLYIPDKLLENSRKIKIYP